MYRFDPMEDLEGEIAVRCYEERRHQWYLLLSIGPTPCMPSGFTQKS